jgi:hypothetical protein
MSHRKSLIETNVACQCLGGHCENHAKDEPCEETIDPTLPTHPSYIDGRPVSGRSYGWCRECYEVYVEHSGQ